MLFFIRATIKQPTTMSERELYSIWKREAEVVLKAKEAGVVKALYKVSGVRQVLAIVDVPSHRDLDNAIAGLPIMKEMGHSVDLEILPIHPYEEFAEDLKKYLESE